MVDGARMYSRLKTRTTQVGRTEAEVRSDVSCWAFDKEWSVC